MCLWIKIWKDNMKKRLLSKLLSKSNQYQFYKKNYSKQLKENKRLEKRYDNLLKRNEKLVERNQKVKEKNKAYKEKIDDLRDSNLILKDEKRNLKIERRDLKKQLNFINFDEYLCYSYLQPVLKKPFSDNDKRCFAFMDYLSEYLTDIALHNEQPLVSVILPSYNRADTILVAVNSVLNQTYENLELIIVDDASQDGTADILKSLDDDRVKLIFHETNKGVSAARNTALKEANGKYVAYLDSDNEWDLNYLSAMVGAFLLLDDADALYSGQILYTEFDSQPYAIRFSPFNKPLIHNRNFIDLNCFCHKLDVIDKVGNFDESLIKFVDWDLILRISNEFKIYSVPVLLCKYFNHSNENRITTKYNNDTMDYFEYVSKIINKHKKNYTPCDLTKKISIIIPNYESLNELKDCVDSILEFNPEMTDIIIVDNNSSNEVVEYLKMLNETDKAKVIFNNENYGFTYAINQGIEASDENSDIVILNNDAVLTQGAIGNLQKFAYDNENCGIVVPHEILFDNDPDIRNNVPYAFNNFECDKTPSKIYHNIINMPIFHDGEALELNFAPFFCPYIKRDVYNKTLGINPKLGRHYRADSIFSDYVRHVLKMKIYQSPDSYVYHKNHVATDKLKENEDEYKSMIIENQWDDKLSDKLGYSKRLWDI